MKKWRLRENRGRRSRSQGRRRSPNQLSRAGRGHSRVLSPERHPDSDCGHTPPGTASLVLGSREKSRVRLHRRTLDGMQARQGQHPGHRQHWASVSEAAGKAAGDVKGELCQSDARTRLSDGLTSKDKLGHSGKGGKVKVKVAQSCPTLRPRGLCPRNSPGRNTAVG